MASKLDPISLERVKQLVDETPGIWLGDDNRLRRGRSDDLVQMLDDLGIPTRVQ